VGASRAPPARLTRSAASEDFPQVVGVHLLHVPVRVQALSGFLGLAQRPDVVMGRLAALVPPPRMHLTRYHGVFAPHSRLRAAITPAGRGAGGKGAKPNAEAPAVPKHAVMSWAQRLKRVFAI
jgi:hypothetical protein